MSCSTSTPSTGTRRTSAIAATHAIVSPTTSPCAIHEVDGDIGAETARGHLLYETGLSMRFPAAVALHRRHDDLARLGQPRQERAEVSEVW